MMARQEVKDRPRPPHEPVKTGDRGEGARWIAEDLPGASVRVVIDRGERGIVVHEGAPTSVRVRFVVDADPRDVSDIGEVLPAKAEASEVVR